MTKQQQVRPGQVWESCDKRDNGRRLEVGWIDGDFAFCRSPGSPTLGRHTRIRLDRFRPISTGYRLVKDVSDG